jgi:hypothetical protein
MRCIVASEHWSRFEISLETLPTFLLEKSRGKRLVVLLVAFVVVEKLKMLIYFDSIGCRCCDICVRYAPTLVWTCATPP